ncbi:MAG: small multi-drug export protein [Lachnospiraceae bacterium]
MESIVTWFTVHLAPYLSEEMAVFIISLLPILELRGGLLAASLLKVPLMAAVPICIIGNILPIPFILLFIKKIFQWMKRFSLFRPMVEWLEAKAMGKSDKIARWEFWGLVLFVGIPLPGTGAWTGSLIAALLGIEFKKSILAELLGICIAAVIMVFLSYGVLANIVN